MKVIIFIFFFFVLSSLILRPHPTLAEGVSTGGVKQCMLCERKEGQKAFIIFDGFSNKCSYVYDGSDCDGKTCYIEGSRVDPIIDGDNGTCPNNTTCSGSPYEGCVATGTEEPLSCKPGITSCSYSAACRPFNSCAKNYCVIYRDGVPLEVIKEYSTQYTQGVCTTLSTPPQVASPSEVGYYAKSSATTIVGAGTNSIEDPNDPANPPGPIATCNNGDYKGCLKKEFNINIQSGTGEQISDLFNILSQFGRSSLYKRLLFESGPTDVRFSPGSVNCSAHVAGYTYANTLMEFWNFDSARCNTYTRKDRILHESGHVIKNGKGRLFQRFISEAYYPKNSNCYYQDSRFTGGPWFMKTYSTKFAASINNFSITGSNESFAESMANYRSSPTPLHQVLQA
jgi:hypothetical protein